MRQHNQSCMKDAVNIWLQTLQTSPLPPLQTPQEKCCFRTSGGLCHLESIAKLMVVTHDHPNMVAMDRNSAWLMAIRIDHQQLSACHYATIDHSLILTGVSAPLMIFFRLNSGESETMRISAGRLFIPVHILMLLCYYALTFSSERCCIINGTCANLYANNQARGPQADTASSHFSRPCTPP